MSDPTAPYSPEDSAAALVRVLDQYLADLQAGRPADRARVLAEHPELAAQLEQCLAGIEFVHRAGHTAADAPAQLGDFRIVREVGRGGMGVVYEAEQLSLKRRVALKVLRFGAVADEEVLERFRREAETVARLHHTSIVPIFAVGAEQGVHYYAMQFIEGRSLAAVQEEARHAGHAPAAFDIARWGLQAAEALAHAHQRGVIHRDIKPSNLLLDASATVWLTDFGLAKRLDEVTLTLSGVLMGTPRYMSPEQAAGLKQPVDQRTDVYSLGATLYELATGRPVFDADSPQGVISQILTAEPVRPSLLQPRLPRDLETIILTCLAKEPDRRYATAQALAEDLRAFLDGRAIKARRPSLAERAVRWARKQRRGLAIGTAAAVAAALLTVGGVLGALAYRNDEYQASLGEVLLSTDGPPLLAEVLSEVDEQPVLPRFPVPGQQPITVPGGLYRLRLSGVGQLSQTFPLEVESGSKVMLKVGLDDRRLWEPLTLGQHMPQVVSFGRRADLILRSEQGVRRLDGGTLKPVWEIHTRGPANAWQPDPAAEKLGYAPQQIQFLTNTTPTVLQPAPDLDGDGTPDLVWTNPFDGAMLAVSGSTARVLWWRPAGGEALAGVRVLPDVDGDGTPDLLATFTENPFGPVGPMSQRRIEAISGHTGKTIWTWTYRAQDGWFPNLPIDANWQTRERPAALVIRLGGKAAAACLVGTRVVTLDLRTGKPLLPPRDVGVVSERGPWFADLDGDGDTDVLCVSPVTAARDDRPPDIAIDDGPDPRGRNSLLTAVSLRTGAALWQTRVRAPAMLNQYENGPPLEWPVVADLDGGGRADVIVPNQDTSDNTIPTSRGLDVLDGATGRVRWRRRWQSIDWTLDRFDHLTVGPDIDGDGSRDVFAAVQCSEGEKHYLFIEAFSGRDGHTLWWTREPVGPAKSGGPGPLQWWPAGPDGWPLLVVPFGHDQQGNAETVYLVGAGDGRVVNLLAGVSDIQVADADGDGIPDLLALRRATQFGGLNGAKLVGFRGRPPEAWRRQGDWQAVQDLDGDGLADVVAARDYSTRRGTARHRTVALSGRDGHVLWQADAAVNPGGIFTWPLPEGDVNGDGVPDILTGYEPVALSGKDGTPLWQSQLREGATSIGTVSYFPPSRWYDLAGDGRRELLHVYNLGFDTPRGRSETRLAALRGETGLPLWSVVLTDQSPPLNNYGVGNLYGDGRPQVVVCALDAAHRFELRALDGRDGRVRWRRMLGKLADGWNSTYQTPLQWVGDLAGNGRAEIVLVEVFPAARPGARRNGKAGGSTQQADPGYLLVSLLDGRDGHPRWKARVDGDEEAYPAFASARVHKANLAGIGPALCLDLYGSAFRMPQLAILDAGGHIRERHNIKSGSLHVGDVDGDRKDELLWIDGGKLHVTRGGTTQVAWAWPLPGGDGNIVDILPGAPGRPPTVAMEAGGRGYGLDGRTGRQLWHAPTATLLRDRPGEPPRSLLRLPGYTVCYLSTRLRADGAAVAVSGTPHTDAAERDPRLARPLPWHGDTPIPFALVSVGMSVAVLVVPAFLLSWTLRRPSWRRWLILATYLGLVALACVVGWVPRELNFFSRDFWVAAHMMGMIGLGGAFNYELVRWVRVVAGLPLAVYALCLLWWAWRRRWRRVAALLGLALLLSPLAAWLFLLEDRSATGFYPRVDAGQYYTWDGWYWIGFWGAFLAGVVLLAVLAAVAVRRWLRSRAVPG